MKLPTPAGLPRAESRSRLKLSTVSLSLPTSADQCSTGALLLRRRRDLRFRQMDRGRWSVLDPISRQSYRVGLVEHWLLTRPDGKTSPQGLLRRLRTEFPTLKMSDEQVLASLMAFRRNNLLMGSEPPDSHQPLGHANWQSWLGSFVVWQIRGIQPDRWLARVAPRVGVLFSAAAVQFWLVAAFLTSLLVLFEFKRLSSHGLTLDWIMHPTTGGMLLGVFVVTRALHELGHALVCKRYGVRCPDIGLFVILGAPCVYCDVSESWQLPHRWQRAAVASAGMYVEMIVATLAAWIWLLTIDGTVNTLALQTMFVCSLSTLIININPLMRFDGYYILADWLDEVNLRTKADTVAAASLNRLLLGVEEAAHAVPRPRRRFLLCFSLAGWVYRAGLSLTVATVLVTIYSGWNLQWLGRFLALAILVSWWGVPAMKLSRSLVGTARQYRKGWRLAVAAAVLVALIAWLPLPSRRFAVGWVQPAESRGVYASTSGRLIGLSAGDGQSVRQGEHLFQLEDPQLEIRLIGYQQAAQAAAIRLESNKRRRDMHGQDVDVQHFANQLTATQSWLEAVQRERDALALRAPMDGRLVAMAAPQSDASGDSAQPSTWCDARQVGRFVAEGNLLASVCSDDHLAVIPLDEEQLDTIAAGTAVRLRIAEQNLVLVDQIVESVVSIDELTSPWQAAALASMDERLKLASPTSGSQFAAVVKLPTGIGGLPGSTVDAVFVGDACTVAQYAVRWLRSNLRLLAD